MPETEGFVRPALDEVTSDIYEPVKLRMDSTSHGSLPPITISELFERTVEQFPNHPALSFKDQDNQWQTLNYTEYKEKIYQTAKAFIRLGLRPHDVVSIMAFNCPEWFYAELGAIFAGGVFTGVYTTSSPEAVLHILSSSHTRIAVIDDKKQMAKIREIWSKLPELKAVIQINGPFELDIGSADGYYKWSDLEQMDIDGLDGELEIAIKSIAANECCGLIYTSGTVGFPKAAMLSHDNITWNLRMIEERFGNIIPGTETYVSYLPMSHIAAQMVDIFLAISAAGCVTFADRDALKGSLVKTLSRVHPTRFIGVPRVYEKFYEQLIKMESKLPTIKKALFNWARNRALEHHMNRTEGRETDSVQYRLAKMLILNKIKFSLGLDQVRIALVGGAPTSHEVKKYFFSLDIPIDEVFGMSESTGASFMTDRNVSDWYTCGKALSGVSVKIHNPDENGAGEICYKGRNVFMGYLNEPEKTKETVDENGWLCSGDLGTIDENGFCYVTGRLKELIITAGGENIPPVHIENLVKSELPIVSNAILIGDKRKYLSILLTLKVEVNPDTGIPSEKLSPEVREWLEAMNLQYKTVAEVLNAGTCPIVLKALEEGITKANRNVISNAQKVQKFAILPQDFSVATGELGPTLKLKRNFVINKYHDIIEGLYQ